MITAASVRWHYTSRLKRLGQIPPDEAEANC